MSTELLLTWISVSILGLILPGPDFFFITSLSSRKRRYGIFGGIGIQIGIICWMTVTMLGISALIMSVPWGYHAIEFFGACNLLYMGYGIVTGSYKQYKEIKHASQAQIEGLERDFNQQTHASIDQQELSDFKCLHKGLVVNLLNPKCALFFITVIPLFIDPQHVSSLLEQSWWSPLISPQFLVLLIVHVVIGLIYWTMLSVLVNALVTKFSSPMFRCKLELVSGSILSLIALWMFISASYHLYDTLL